MLAQELNNILAIGESMASSTGTANCSDGGTNSVSAQQSPAPANLVQGAATVVGLSSRQLLVARDGNKEVVAAFVTESGWECAGSSLAAVDMEEEPMTF